MLGCPCVVLEDDGIVERVVLCYAHDQQWLRGGEPLPGATAVFGSEQIPGALEVWRPSAGGR